MIFFFLIYFFESGATPVYPEQLAGMRFPLPTKVYYRMAKIVCSEFDTPTYHPCFCENLLGDVFYAWFYIICMKV